MADQSSTTITRRPLGSQGLLVSTQGLGCMGMSAFYGGRDDEESTATLHRALDLGITFLDTAEAYGPFTNEILVGKAIAGRRDEVQVATKFGTEFDDDGLAHDINGRPDYAHRAIDRSLRHLGTDYVDLYYLHRVDPDVPIEDTMDAMADMFMAGKIRYVGLSEVSPETIRRAHLIHPITAVQSEYSLFARGPELDGVLRTCRELGIGFVPYSPLGRGFLTGEITSVDDLAPDDARRGLPWFSPENIARNVAVVEVLKSLARAKGVTASQLALAWVLAQDTIPIPGTKRRRWLEDNAAAASIKLTTADLAAIDKAAPHGVAAGERNTPQGLATTNR
ncbi:aldo/keto reductase [Umezawaea sp. Da 62-37]|uniref:aldo/keto reductase n=1 Tax=Umezawaea sp. Da 62-37 TaxID=3075927 RepID=UPI0028F74B02|nr:aldo/keto reductase [Umezawaea sp. Da 62-37]WNV90023.1 aldo/keto reductase [Umezawaea sp. Da 62-37]